MTIHQANITKQVAKELWAETPGWQKDIIAADSSHTTNSFSHFDRMVKTRAQQIYEDETRFENGRDRWP